MALVKSENDDSDTFSSDIWLSQWANPEEGEMIKSEELNIKKEDGYSATGKSQMNLSNRDQSQKKYINVAKDSYKEKQKTQKTVKSTRRSRKKAPKTEKEQRTFSTNSRK